MPKLSDSFQISRLYHPSQTDAKNLSRISKASKAYSGFHTFDYHPSQPGDRKLPIMEKPLG